MQKNTAGVICLFSAAGEYSINNISAKLPGPYPVFFSQRRWIIKLTKLLRCASLFPTAAYLCMHYA